MPNVPDMRKTGFEVEEVVSTLQTLAKTANDVHEQMMKDDVFYREAYLERMAWIAAPRWKRALWTVFGRR